MKFTLSYSLFPVYGKRGGVMGTFGQLQNY